MVTTAMCAWFLSTAPSKKRLKYHLVIQVGFGFVAVWFVCFVLFFIYFVLEAGLFTQS